MVMNGDKVHAARKVLGLSQTGLAEALGIGFRTVQRMEAEGCTHMAGLAIERLLLKANHAKLARYETALREIGNKAALPDLFEAAEANSAEDNRPARQYSGGLANAATQRVGETQQIRGQG